METDVKNIAGVNAVDKMRLIKSIPGETFGLIFFTHSHSNGKYSTLSELRKYENCRLRTAQNSEGLSINSDHYIYFIDCETNEPKQCWKKLIRKVRFGNQWYKVQWFN